MFFYFYLQKSDCHVTFRKDYFCSDMSKTCIRFYLHDLSKDSNTSVLSTRGGNTHGTR